MPETSVYTFTHAELIELLIKAAKVHEGLWMLNIHLGIGQGNFGPTPDEQYPGIAVGVAKIGIQRAVGENIPKHLMVDATKVNPEPK